MRLQQARALELLGAGEKAEAIARPIATDRSATPQDRWAAWCRIASVRSQAEDYPAVAEALQRASQEIPSSADTYRSLGAVYDLELSKPAEALAAYRTFIALGGKDPLVEERIRSLGGSASGDSR